MDRVKTEKVNRFEQLSLRSQFVRKDELWQQIDEIVKLSSSRVRSVTGYQVFTDFKLLDYDRPIYHVPGLYPIWVVATVQLPTWPEQAQNGLSRLFTRVVGPA